MTKFSPLPHPGHLGSDYTPSLTGKRILIVDDSAACRMVQEAMAKAMGAFVETAETAVQAMVASDASTFDLIILDIGLADADGRVLARTLRETPNGKAAAILCVSGLGGQNRIEGALVAGADAFTEKPFASVAAFGQASSNAITRHLGSSKIADQIAEQAPAHIEFDDALSPHIASYAIDDLSRARARLLAAVSKGDVSAARRAGHFISGVASLIGETALGAASRSLEIASGDTGALRSVEAVLGLAFEAEIKLKTAIS